MLAEDGSLMLLPIYHCLFGCLYRYHLDLCKNVFGDSVYPKVDVTNVYYGGTKIAGL